jgi:Protein of unknown function (DUF4236)
MGWRFRKSFSPLPGIRLNFSPRGISTSVGVGPARLSLGSQGVAVTARVPGTGISYRQPIHLPHSAPEHQAPTAPQPAIPKIPTPVASVANEIRSASTATLTSEGLEPVKELLVTAQAERAKLLPELREAQNEAALLRSKYERWQNGWLFRRLLRGYFARLGEMSVEATEKEVELREQERLSRLATEFDLPENLKDAFGRVCDAAAMLSQSKRIWDTLSSTATDRYRERTTASYSIQRKTVTVSLGCCDLIESSWKVPHLMNANGGEIFIYPGFILYHVSREAFALVDIRDATLDYNATSFIEEEAIPTDAQLIGHTWKKANKDGSPDRRFANNYQIPILAYGGIRLASKSGLNEEYLISNAVAAQGFAQAWTAFKSALPRAIE